MLCKYYDFLKRQFIFLERRKGRVKQREWNISVQLPLTYPLLGPVPQACAPIGNRTGDPLLRSLVTDTNQGQYYVYVSVKWNSIWRVLGRQWFWTLEVSFDSDVLKLLKFAVFWGGKWVWPFNWHRAAFPQKALPNISAWSCQCPWYWSLSIAHGLMQWEPHSSFGRELRFWNFLCFNVLNCFIRRLCVGLVSQRVQANCTEGTNNSVALRGREELTRFWRTYVKNRIVVLEI